MPFKIRLGWIAFLAVTPCFSQVAVTTYHYNNERTGANLSESILNNSNVGDSTFGKLFSLGVDAPVYAQPLYVPGVKVGGTAHNVVYIVTENNSVYAFDADRGGQPLWSVNLGAPIPCAAIQYCPVQATPTIGITSTPVIDTARGTIYVAAETYTANVAGFYLHALDYSSGRERTGSPAAIAGSVAGTGADAVAGKVTFSPLMHWQRAGLLELNGNIYIAFGSHQDSPPYHGWIFGYDGVSMRRVLIKCFTPNGNRGGIWQAGAGLAADASGNVYASVGNGDYDANTGGSDYGNSVLKMNAITGMTVSLEFTPSNVDLLNGLDWDVGSTGPILLPGDAYAIAGCKDGRVFLLNTSNLGGYSNSGDSVVQEWHTGGALFGDPIFYNNTLYEWPMNQYLQAYQFNGSGFNGDGGAPTPQLGPDFTAYGNSNEAGMSLSANGTTAGTGIVWASWSLSGNSDGTSYTGILAAYDASSLTRLWTSEDNHNRDSAGSWAKWVPPMVANGKVYLPTLDNLINVYGILPQ